MRNNFTYRRCLLSHTSLYFGTIKNTKMIKLTTINLHIINNLIKEKLCIFVTRFATYCTLLRIYPTFSLQEKNHLQSVRRPLYSR